MTIRPAAALFAAAFLLAVALLPALPSPGSAAEYRMSDYRSPTPATVPGARTVTTAEVEELARSGEAVLIDVYPAPPRPAGLPADSVWIPKPRDTIPGAV